MVFKSLRHSRLGAALRLARLNPSLAPTALAAVAFSTARRPDAPQILVGTHHKVLTVYFLNIFSTFALVTGRSISAGKGLDVDYSADILRDHHSKFSFDEVRPGSVGVHVIRDPRDVLVSAAKYHVRASEQWLHQPMDEFGGETYQERISGIADEEDRLIFELEHSTSETLNDFAQWDYNRAGMSELRYEELLLPSGDRVFAQAIASWPLHSVEKKLLVGLFQHYSIHGRGSKGHKHIRNPSPQQWKAHFTPAVQAAFDTRFPGLIERLGYE